MPATCQEYSIATSTQKHTFNAFYLNTEVRFLRNCSTACRNAMLTANEIIPFIILEIKFNVNMNISGTIYLKMKSSDAKAS